MRALIRSALFCRAASAVSSSRVDDKLAHSRNVARGCGDDEVIAGVGEYGIGVAAVVRIGFAPHVATLLQPRDQV